MPRDFHIPLIERERILPRRDSQIGLRHFHHNRPAHLAKRAVTCRKLREVRGDLEFNSATMACGVVGGHRVKLI